MTVPRWETKFTLYQIAFHGAAKNYSVLRTPTARGGTSRSQGLTIVPARLIERVGALNSSHHSLIFTSASVGSSPRSNLFTSGTGRVGVYTALKYGTKPIRYVTLHFRDRHSAAMLFHRNRAATTTLMCAPQKRYLVGFKWRRKSYLV